MEKQQALERLAKLQLTVYAYHHAQSCLHLDSATVAPMGGAQARSQTLGILSEKTYELLTGAEMTEVLACLSENSAELSQAQKRQIELLAEERDRLTRIPVEEYAEFTRLSNEAEVAWRTAKEENNYPLFQPYLEKLIAFKRRFAAYKDSTKPAYDVLLDEYEKGANQAMLDQFFASLREKLVPLLMAVKDLEIRDDFLIGHFPEAAQRELSTELMRLMAIDPMHCALQTTEHPFCMGVSKYDVRITTHYHEDDFASSLYSVIHESGHALYDMGIADEYQYTCLADGASMGIHESQSRFYENIIARSEGFISHLWPTLKRLFPEALCNCTPREFYRAVNRAKPSLIRIEADELTYSLHVMVRYELEKQLIAGELDTHDLPQAWNRLYQEYLGVDVPDDTHGVLQDIHWSGGDFGYFPTYVLGSAYGAQLAHVIRGQMNMDELVQAGNLAPITAWLRENIHRHGALMKPKDLLLQACSEPFDVKYYVSYLEKKMKDVYGL